MALNGQEAQLRGPLHPRAGSRRGGRTFQIERGKVVGRNVLTRHATVGGRLHLAIYFDDGDITAIA